MTRRGRPPKISREEIAAATLTVLRERGIARLTTREIAQRIGISEGSIFYHFGDRKGLLKAVFEEALRPLWQLGFEAPVPARDAAGVRAGLDDYATRVNRFLEAGLAVLIPAQADAELRSEIASIMVDNDYGPQRGVLVISEFLGAAKKSGIIDADVDVQTVAHMLTASGFLRRTQPLLLGHDRGLPTPDQVLDTAMSMLTRAGRPDLDGPRPEPAE